MISQCEGENKNNNENRFRILDERTRDVLIHVFLRNHKIFIHFIFYQVVLVHLCLHCKTLLLI